jgi:Spy/CpxP family protein refolding chaperone
VRLAYEKISITNKKRNKMKKVFQIMAALALVIALTGVSAFAQTEETTNEPIRQRARVHMTDAQKEMMQQNRGLNSENRQALRATFTEEQLAIIQNMEMTREERREALRATFSEEQLAMIQANQQVRQAQRQALRNCLSPEQVGAMKQQARQRGKGNGQRGGGN